MRSFVGRQGQIGLVVLFVSWIQIATSAFLAPSFIDGKTRCGSSVGVFSTAPNNVAVSDDSSDSFERLDVVLFGVGDLRTVDHGGIVNALRAQQKSHNSRLLALTVLDETTLSRIPGAVAHTVDTAAIISAALQDLQSSLQIKFGLDLHVVHGTKSFREGLDNCLSTAGSSVNIHLHACDLGDVDNGFAYGPYSSLKDLPDNFTVNKWTCPLREEPFKNLDSIPDNYPEYTAKYNFDALQSLKDNPTDVRRNALLVEEFTKIPSGETIAQVIQSTLQLNEKQCEAEKNTGLYGSHWGGLDPSTIGESQVLKVLRSYTVDCEENDERWVKHPTYDKVLRKCRRNGKSLEHASVAWMMKGDGKTPLPSTENMLHGESMTRYLSAPLLFGTVSPRYLWHSALIRTPFFTSSLREVAEAREWHQLLGAKRVRTSNPSEPIQYKFWRWHGFLCRYAALTEFTSTKVEPPQKQGVLLVHGFGASGTQMIKLMQELSKQEIPACETLAPDLIGFGECEKPPVTYTQYLWENFVLDFCKEVALGQQQWDSFVIGGNSIGGYTSMSVAANDAVEIGSPQVSGSGAPGTNRCRGVVLMNSAGQVQLREQVEQLKAKTPVALKTVAQMTAMDALPSCRPIARPVARLFGLGLLTYLRPRIKSISTNLYPTNPDAVDEALCGGIYRDSLDPGAINVMMSGSKLPPSRTANELLVADFGAASDTHGDLPESGWKGPVLIATGILDPLNDAKTRTQMFGALREGITMDPIDAGHCPHDELPDRVAASVAKWMTNTEVICSGPTVSVQDTQQLTR